MTNDFTLPSGKKVVFRNSVKYGDVRKYEMKKTSLYKIKEDDKIDFQSYAIAMAESAGLLVFALCESVDGKPVTETTHDEMELFDGGALHNEVKMRYDEIIEKKSSQEMKLRPLNSSEKTNQKEE